MEQVLSTIYENNKYIQTNTTMISSFFANIIPILKNISFHYAINVNKL